MTPTLLRHHRAARRSQHYFLAADAQRAVAAAARGPDLRGRCVVAEGAAAVETRRRLQHRHRCAGQCLRAASPAHAEARGRRQGRAAGHGVRPRRQFRQILGRRRAAASTGPSASTASTSTTRASPGSAATTARPPALAGLKPVADDALLKFTLDGKFVLQIGKSNQSKGDTDTVNVHRAADAWVLAAAPTSCSSPTATAITASSCSMPTPARSSGPGAPSASRRAAIDNCAIVGPKTFPEGDGPPDFNVAHAIRVANDGMVYVADRENRRVQMFTSDGKFVKQLVRTATPFARDLALSPDPEQQFLYVGGGKAIVVLDRKTLDVVGRDRGAGPDRRAATTSRPIPKATSTSRRPPPACRSWCSRACRRWRRGERDRRKDDQASQNHVRQACQQPP